MTDAGAKTTDGHISVVSFDCHICVIPLCTVPGFDCLLCVSAPQPPSLLAGMLLLMSIFSISFALSDLSEAVPERYPACGNGRRCCDFPPHPLLAGAGFCCKYWPPPFLAIKGVRWIYKLDVSVNAQAYWLIFLTPLACMSPTTAPTLRDWFEFGF